MKATDIVRATALACALLASACSPQTTTDTPPTPGVAVHPESGLEIIPVTVFTENGSHAFSAEVAETTREQARGLMFRTEMADDEGMLFPYENNPRRLGFWMRNTVISLDIIFIGVDGRILNIAENAVPYSEESLTSDGVAAAVLEINGGLAAELGIGQGDRVDW